MPKRRSEIEEGTTELASQAAADLLAESGREAAALLFDAFAPGAKVLRGLVGWWQGREAEKFVRGIATELGWDEGEMAAARLRDEVQDPTKQARITLGFRALLETWDEIARECITLLVADSLRGGMANREYQLAARLLSECDERLLLSLEVVAACYGEMLDKQPHSAHAIRCLGVDDEGRVFVTAFAPPGLADPPPVGSAGRSIHALEGSIGVLERYDLGRRAPFPDGMPGSPFAPHSGIRKLEFDPAHDERMRALFRYLAPVRVRSKAG